MVILRPRTFSRAGASCVCGNVQSRSASRERVRVRAKLLLLLRPYVRATVLHGNRLRAAPNIRRLYNIRCRRRRQNLPLYDRISRCFVSTTRI